MKHLYTVCWILFFCIRCGTSLFAQPHHAEWPSIRPGDKVVCHQAYCLVYNEEHEQASWVAYELTVEETIKAYGRSDKFREDPDIRTGSATDADYAGSGFDRGHLAPAADMGWSAQAMEESFYYSNMSPQSPPCNRGIWKKGEELVRDWARQYGKILVVTGPVLSPGLPTIGPNKVSVPEYYFKVLLRRDSIQPQVMAFLVPNHGSRSDLSEFAVPVDKIEQLTDLNFFPWLPDSIENQLEGKVCLPCWDWSQKAGTRRGGISENTPPQHRRSPLAVGDEDEFRCHGITKKGTRCKRKVRVGGTNCYQHGG